MTEREHVLTGTVADGHYARKQLRCRSSVIAFSHQARYRTAVALAGTHPDGVLLDYGCGDGTFLALVAGNFSKCVGTDNAVDQIDDCTARFAGVPNVTFAPTTALHDAKHAGAYQIVTCMEVLEHCTPGSIDIVLRDLCRAVAPGGSIIISVPIETGPSFLLKYAVRTVAGWRNLGDYRHYETYSLREAARMVCASGRTRFDRPVYGDPGKEFYSHFGFNWRSFRRRLSESLIVERTRFSPFNLLDGWFSSQVWFICRPRSA
jgi:SAM-dependent methyltransferase